MVKAKQMDAVVEDEKKSQKIGGTQSIGNMTVSFGIDEKDDDPEAAAKSEKAAAVAFDWLHHDI